MNKQLAFVLSGGGARGALQVGALRALLEANIQPDLMVGTSIGAINATYMAVRGVRADSVATLAQVWLEAAANDLLTSNYLWATLNTLLNRSSGGVYKRMRDFIVAHGLSPDLRFGDIHGVRLIVVAADLNAGRPVLYGHDPQQSVLEAVLASAALPPWITPLEKGEQLLIDGGIVSNLPIEAALAQGATEIIALDLADSRDVPVKTRGWLSFLVKLTNTAQQRQTELELALAAARKVSVRYMALCGAEPVAVWDFHRAEELIARGYEIARREIAQWQPERPAGWLRRQISNIKSQISRS